MASAPLRASFSFSQLTIERENCQRTRSQPGSRLAVDSERR